MRPVQEALGEGLRRLRKMRGFTQAVLAERAECATTFIQDVEAGRSWVSAEMFQALADSLEVEPYELLYPIPTKTKKDRILTSEMRIQKLFIEGVVEKAVSNLEADLVARLTGEDSSPAEKPKKKSSPKK